MEDFGYVYLVVSVPKSSDFLCVNLYHNQDRKLDLKCSSNYILCLVRMPTVELLLK